MLKVNSNGKQLEEVCFFCANTNGEHKPGCVAKRVTLTYRRLSEGETVRKFTIKVLGRHNAYERGNRMLRAFEQRMGGPEYCGHSYGDSRGLHVDRYSSVANFRDAAASFEVKEIA